MHRRISVILAATLLLLTLSGLQIGADGGNLYADESGEFLSDETGASVTISWSVSDNDINVEMMREWDPSSLSYVVKSVNVTEMCAPTLLIGIINQSLNYYCSAEITISPASGFALSVPSTLTAYRSEIDKSEAGVFSEYYYYPIETTVAESISARQDTSGLITIGPWTTASKRAFWVFNGKGSGISSENGSSTLSFTLNVSNPTLLASLSDINNWTGTTYNYGNSISIATVTVTLEMIDIPAGYTSPSSTSYDRNE